MSKPKISIIGSGAVGSRTGKYFRSKDFDVTFYDTNQAVLEALRKEGYGFVNDAMHAIAYSDVSFVSVPTPLNDKENGFVRESLR